MSRRRPVAWTVSGRDRALWASARAARVSGVYNLKWWTCPKRESQGPWAVYQTVWSWLPRTSLCSADADCDAVGICLVAVPRGGLRKRPTADAPLPASRFSAFRP